LNWLDPEDYLRKVIACTADHSVRRVHELLPWNLERALRRLDQRDAPERRSKQRARQDYRVADRTLTSKP
jgi:hypothetical protein